MSPGSDPKRSDSATQTPTDANHSGVARSLPEGPIVCSGGRGSRGNRGGGGPAKTIGKRRGPYQPSGTALQTWAFDSVGPRKYALQLRKAANGNPSLRIVEGVPSKGDRSARTGSRVGRADNSSGANSGGGGKSEFRKFSITVWSEDFDRFFELVDQMRAYIDTNDIRTPAGHKYKANRG